MRVLWVLADLTLDTGSVLAQWVIPVLADAGMEVEVLPLAPTAASQGLASFTVPVLEAPLRHRKLGTHLQALGILRRALGRYDRVVVTQDLDVELRAVMAKAAMPAGARLILWAHLPLTHFLAARGEHTIGKTRRLIGRLYGKFDRVITVSHEVGADLVQSHRVPLQTLRTLSPPLPLDTWEHPVEDAPAVRGRLPIVAALGYLEHVKGMEVLLQSLRLLKERGLDTQLLVIGEGPSKASLQEQSRALELNAQFVGWVANWGAWLASADMFVAPQYFDGAALDVWAAMAMGVPLVATNAPVAPREALEQGKFGKIVSIGEPLALTEALADGLHHPQPWADRALKARQRARATDRARVGAQWVEAIRS